MPFTYSVLATLQKHLSALKPVSYDATISSYILTGIIGQLQSIYPGVIISPRYTVAFEHKNPQLERVSNVRIIMSRDKSIDPMTPLQSVFNGVVVDVIAATIVNSSPRALSTQPSRAILADLAPYAIYPVIDGTVLTMYKRAVNDWHISTARGVDIDATTMFGTTPLLSLVLRTLADNNICIDAYQCVSMVFTHPEWHPAATAPSARIIEIRDINLDLISAPTLQSHTIQPLDKLPAAGTGYILRAKLDYQSTHSDYMDEGSHMSLMRRCVYAPSHTIRDIKLIALHVYLVNINRGALVGACPQFAAMFTQTDDRIEQLITRIQSKLRSSKAVYTLTRFEIAATYFVTLLTPIVQPNNPQIRSIIRDFVVNINHVTVHEKFIL